MPPGQPPEASVLSPGQVADAHPHHQRAAPPVSSGSSAEGSRSHSLYKWHQAACPVVRPIPNRAFLWERLWLFLTELYPSWIFCSEPWRLSFHSFTFSHVFWQLLTFLISQQYFGSCFLLEHTGSSTVVLSRLNSGSTRNRGRREKTVWFVYLMKHLLYLCSLFLTLREAFFLFLVW